MGLPLFNPPEEYDAQSRNDAQPPAETSNSRSPIRRQDRRRLVAETREQRLRQVAEARIEARVERLRRMDAVIQPSDPRERRPRQPIAPRDPHIRVVARALETQLRRLDGELGGIIWPAPTNESTTVGDPFIGHRQRQDPVSGSVTPRPRHTVNDPGLGNEAASPGQRSFRARSNHGGMSARTPRAFYDWSDLETSPEPESAWLMLQATVTPDPMPISAASSFMSAAAPAGVSQPTGENAATNEMATQTEDGDAPCDPVPDDTENGNDAEPSDETSQPLGSQVGPPLAHIAFSDITGPGEIEPEWLSGMHRVVRILASRSDIPDEWWAQAGLTRSTSTAEGSN